MESEVLGPTQNSKNGETVKNPKTVELVRSDYQPTKAEQKEGFRMDASLERDCGCRFESFNIRWIDKPRNRRRRSS